VRSSLEIYDCLLQSPDRVAAVAGLTDADLADVSGMLLQDYDENTSSGEILGICLVERSDRWARQHRAQTAATSAQGEGFL
jgi:hypothetical protein